MPRFVVLEHDWPAPHLDLFLDAGAALLAWKLPADFSPLIPAVILPNAPHRRDYLDHEGAVAGGRGVVVRWDFGEFEWLVESEDVLKADFAGQVLSGAFEWRRSDTGVWTFRKVT